MNDIWQDLREINTDWSGRLMDNIPEKVISKAREIFEALPAKFMVFPTGRSTVQLELRYSGMYLEIEIFADLIYAMAVLGNGYDKVEYKKCTNVSEIIEYISGFF